MAFLAALAAASATSAMPKIDTIVVLMEENRAFDHMLGFMARGGPQGDTRVDGLTGTECNSKNIAGGGECVAKASSSLCGKGAAAGAANDAGIICVNDEALDNCAYDPNHAHAPTTERIFGCKYEATNSPNGTTPCSAHASTNGNPTMTGFSQSAIWEGRDGLNEMSMWPSEKVPIITTLAKEFANFDRMFCSHPGPTYPNRQFVHSGAAHGETDDEVPRTGFPQKTIYRQLEENGLDWKMYYEDSLAWAIFMDDLRRNESKANLDDMSEFYKDAAAGTLPSYSFIEPRIAASKTKTSDPSYGLANHQHPVASVLEGERLMKNVYEAVRNGPKWNSTLFIITYDEHGGFFDHVSPPQVGVPNPDGLLSQGGFNYTRLGIRIPTIAISPWIEKNVLVHEAPGSQKPEPTSQWELSSIPATVSKIFDLKGPALSARTAWAATFEHLLSRDTPRTDAPLKLPDLLPPKLGELERQLALPIDEHARGVVKMLCDMNGEGDEDDAAAAGGARKYSHEDESAVEHCKTLGICLPSTGCGSDVHTNEQFSAFREKMWAKWMNA